MPYGGAAAQSRQYWHICSSTIPFQTYIIHTAPRVLPVRSSQLALPVCTQMLAAALPVSHLGGLTSKTTNFLSHNQKVGGKKNGIKHSDFLL